jgi:hypothetical protein
MTNFVPGFVKRSGLLGALALLAALLAPGGASAGVATSGAVLLDPFDPVPEIQFRHYGGYGCNYECGGGYNRCDDGCGYRRHHARCRDACYRHVRCDDACGNGGRDRCDRDCDHHHDDCDGDDCDHHHHHDGDDRAAEAPPCTSGHCSDTEHYEHHWRDGDHIGQEYYDRGRRERDLGNGAGPPGWYGHSPELQDNDDDLAPPPPPPAPPPPPDDGHHHHDH